MDLSRRSFLRIGAAGLLVATVERVRVDAPLLVGDGIHDDTEALQAFIDNKPFTLVRQSLLAHDGVMSGGKFRLTAPLNARGSSLVAFERNSFILDHGGHGFVLRLDGPDTVRVADNHFQMSESEWPRRLEEPLTGRNRSAALCFDYV